MIGHGIIYNTNLWTVSMNYKNLMTIFDQIHDGLCSGLYSNHLLLQIVAQGIAAKGDYDLTFKFHIKSPLILLGYFQNE